MSKRKRNSSDKRARSAARRQRKAQRASAPSPMDLALKLGALGRDLGAQPIPPSALQALLRGGDDNWKRFGASAYSTLWRELKAFDRTSTLAAVAGLLTEPEFHVGTLRLELLQHIVVSACRGTRRATAADASRWVNAILGSLDVQRMEDPLEDVFVSNVITANGNFRIFEGLWELNDATLQPLLEVLSRNLRSPFFRNLLTSSSALLALSEAVAARANTPRWITSTRTTPIDALLPPDLDLNTFRIRAQFTDADLDSLRIPHDVLAPFTLSDEAARRIRIEALGHSSLERFPLILTNEGIYLACPSAVSRAIRRLVLEACANTQALQVLEGALRAVHRREVFEHSLTRLDAPDGPVSFALPEQPLQLSSPPPWDEVHCAIDVDKAAIVLLLADDLTDAANDGLNAPTRLPAFTEQLERHLVSAIEHLGPTAMGGGLVVLAFAGIGRPLILGTPPLPPHWHMVVMSAGDFGMFARSPDASLLRLWKLEEQLSRLKLMEVMVSDINGTLNTYAYWRDRGFSLLPSEMPFPPETRQVLHVATNFIFTFRHLERLHQDVHAARLDADGARIVRVQRLGRSVFFPTMSQRPIYLSEEAGHSGTLVGVCEHTLLTIWVIASRPASGGDAPHIVYQLWEAILSWLDRLLPELEPLFHLPDRSRANKCVVLRLTLKLQDEQRWESIADLSDINPALPALQEDAEADALSVTIPLGFLRVLQQPLNHGERALLEILASGLLRWRDRGASGDRAPSQEGNAVDERARQCVLRAMRNADARHIHLFDASSPTDLISALRSGRQSEPRFLCSEDVAERNYGLAWRVIGRDSRSSTTDSPKHTQPDAPDAHDMSLRVLAGERACTQFLNRVVDEIWKDIRDRLSTLNAQSLISLVLSNLEAISGDREQWRRTARALLALYSSGDDVARIATEREAQRSTASNAGRVLIEMAVCTSALAGGRKASLTDLDYLTAGVSELVGYAFDSDAIRSGFAVPSIRIPPLGTPEVDDAFYREIVAPFSADVHGAKFRAAADAYSRLYRDSRRPNTVSGDSAPLAPRDEEDESNARVVDAWPGYSAEFTAAFVAEYGLSPDRLIDGLAELIDLGLEGTDLVVSTTCGVISSRLATYRGFSAAEITAFFSTLVLQPRPRWEETPSGFRKRDWEPWHFRRRLSVVARPLVACGATNSDATPVLFGLHQLGASASYLYENIQSAWLPSEFFSTDAMIAYRGSVADARGGEFTHQVAGRLQSMGWHARPEVQMSSLGAPKELGDVDVIAWRPGDRRVLLIECKRLQPAKTPGEIGQLLRQFRGQERDRLGRHLRRLEWIHDNQRVFTGWLGYEEGEPVLVPMLVTNRLVPMRFLTNMPLTPEQVLHIDALGSLLDQ